MPATSGSIGRKLVRVMLDVERCDKLVKWTTASRKRSDDAHELAAAAASGAAIPGCVSLDTNYYPVPAATADASGATFTAASPDSATRFVLRGYVDIDPREIDHEIDGTRVYSDPPVMSYRTFTDSEAIGNKQDAAAKLGLNALHDSGYDGSGVAVAIMDSGIHLATLARQLGYSPNFDAGNSWTPPGFTLRPGQYPAEHGTMTAFDVLIAAPKATLLDYPFLISRGPGVHDAQETVSDVLLAYDSLQQMWRTNLAQGPKATYRALVVNNSWGIFNRELDRFPHGHPGRYIDNPDHVFRKSIRALADAGVDIVFAAGNCGKDCPDLSCRGYTDETIMGANAYTEVLTIAGCDINDKRVDYSSQGPSIAGMPQHKPDVTMYTHFVGSETFGNDTPDGGTSAACALASGCVAALRSKIAPSALAPAALFERLRNTARPVGTRPGVWNGDFGYGIMNPAALGQ